MTSRERLIAVAQGLPTDRQSTLTWPASVQAQCSDDSTDAIIVSEFKEAERHSDRAVLVEVTNPFGSAQSLGIDLNHLLAASPEEGSKVLGKLVSETREKMLTSIEAGADGILYRLHGATAEHCTPMQYGGHYLEHDRELLAEVKDARVNLLFIVGDRDLYLDFVSDLPAHLFGWDDRTSGISTKAGKSIRMGYVATYGPAGDVLLGTTEPSVAKMLERSRL